MSIPRGAHPADSPSSLFACEKCGRDFSGANGWERRARHLKEGCNSAGAGEAQGSATREEKRSSSNSELSFLSILVYGVKTDRSLGIDEERPKLVQSLSGKRIDNLTRIKTPLVPPQINTIEDLRAQSEQVLAFLRFNLDQRLQDLSKQGLVSAVLDCQDRDLVKSVELVFHQFEFCCISRKVPQYPISGLKVALFLSEFIGYQPSRASQAALASAPAAELIGLAARPGQRVEATTLMQWVSILQSCAIATSFQLGPDGNYAYSPQAAENLANHPAVVAVLGEAKSQAASEVLASLKSNRSSPTSAGRITPHQSSSSPTHPQNQSKGAAVPTPTSRAPEIVVRPPPPPPQQQKDIPRRKRKHSPPPPPSSTSLQPFASSIPSHPSHIATPGTVVVNPYNFQTWSRDGPLPSPAQLLAGVSWCPPGAGAQRESLGPPLVFSQVVGSLLRRNGADTPRLRPLNVACASPDPLALPPPARIQ